MRLKEWLSRKLHEWEGDDLSYKQQAEKIVAEVQEIIWKLQEELREKDFDVAIYTDEMEEIIDDFIIHKL